MIARFKKNIGKLVSAVLIIAMAFQSIAAPVSFAGPAAAEPAKVTGTWSQDAAGNWSFRSQEGAAKDGWYYLNTTNNATDYNWFCFDANGVMRTGWVPDKNDPSVWYYTGESKDGSEGGLVKGWITDPQDGKKYYLDPSTGIMCHGWKQISGVWYYFGESRYADRRWGQDSSGYWTDGKSGKHTYGALYMNEYTPDGYYVGANGAWVQNHSEDDHSDKPDPIPAYGIIVEADGHGTAKAQVGGADVTSAAPGAAVTLVATANDGYAFKEWQIVRGLEADAITENSFTMPSKEVKVKAVFEKEYAVEAEAGGHGTVSADVAKGVSGKEVNLTITPDEGYEVDQITVVRGGVTVVDNIFNIGTADVKIRVTFKAIVPSTYGIIVEDDGHGTAKAQVGGADVTSAAPGATVTLVATPDDGYQFKEWQVIRGDITVHKMSSTFTMPSKEVKVKAVFQREYTIEVVAQGHGTATASDAKSIAGREITLTATPEDGYKLDHWVVERGGVTVGDNDKFFVGTEDVKIKAVFAAVTPDTYNIIVEDDGHGTAKAQVGGADVTSAAPGAAVTLVATANDGYAFKEWQIVRGLEADAITENSFTMPSKEVKVKAIFERVYNITLQTNEHGKASATVGGKTVTTAAASTEVALTATPDEGYKFKEWKVVSGGVTVTDNKFIMPANNVTVQAVFKEAAPTAPTFKAVYNTTGGANTLTFYYDTVDHSGEGITVFEDGTTNYLFDNSKSKGAKWGYNGIRKSVKSVVIDSTVANYTGLTSTAYMFDDMEYAENISGAEYLDVSQVTNMSNMFYEYGYQSSTLNIVPDVSEWNTGKVTNMSNMFYRYGYKSTALNAVPDVSEWNTVNVTTVTYMFYCYGNNSTALSTVPNVSRWNTGNLTNMASMFSNYGCVSIMLNFTLDLSDWSVASVDTYGKMFESAATKAGKWSVTIPGFTGAQANNETHWYVGDGTATEAYIEPASGKQFTVKTTIADVLDTVPSGFPTSDDAAWVNADGKKAYKDGDNIKVGNLTLGKDTTVTKSGDTYVCNSGDATVTFNVKDGVAESITVTDSGDSDGTYTAPAAPTFETVEDILATVNDFPSGDSPFTAPEDAWINEEGCKLYIYRDGFKDYLEANYESVDLEQSVNKDGANYTCKNDTDATFTFIMTDGVLTSVTVSGSSSGNGTYYAEVMTLQNIIDTYSNDFPTTADAGWKCTDHPDNSMYYYNDSYWGNSLIVDNGRPQYIMQHSHYAHKVDGGYEYDFSGLVLIHFNIQEEGLVSVEVEAINDAYNVIAGTYTAPPAPTEYTVTFDLNGITGTAPEAQKIDENSKVTKPTDPTDAIHTFAGWYKTKDATTGALSDLWDFDNDTVTADMTLYAQWTTIISKIVGTNTGIPTVANFDWFNPATASIPENAWVTDDGKKAFWVPGDNGGFAILHTTVTEDQTIIQAFGLDDSDTFTKVGDTYVLSTPQFTATCTMADDIFTSLTFAGIDLSALGVEDSSIFNGTYTAPETKKLSEILPSGFPTSDDTAWVNADGLKAYKDGETIKVGNLTLGKDTTVTKSGDNYVCKSGDATVTFNVKDGAAESITVTGSNDSDGTYAAPAASVTYMDWDAENKELVEKTVLEDATTEVTSTTETLDAGKFYVVKGNVETGMLRVNGTDANPTTLIICDGAMLTATSTGTNAAIRVQSGYKLVITGQSKGTGKLNAKGNSYDAGIGGGYTNAGGTVIINGGIVTATGGSDGAGIGGGCNAAGGTVTINGGTVTATGKGGGAGIGGGWHYSESGAGGTVTINGGTVTAKGYEAIGKGKDGTDSGTVTFGEGVNFTINAGADEEHTSSMTTAEYSADHSAAYVSIEESAAPTISTVADILATVTFPVGGLDEETLPMDPDSAWVNQETTDYIAYVMQKEDLNKYWDYETEDHLFFIKKGLKTGEDAIPLSKEVTKGTTQNTWVCRVLDWTVTFTVDEDILTSIQFEGSNGGQKDGTYTAPAAVTPKYMDWDASEKKLVEKSIPAGAIDVTNDTTSLDDGKFYVVKGADVQTGTLTVNGTATLILMDGAKLTATGAYYSAGIGVALGKTLVITGQKNGTGILVANGGEEGAGIGGGEQGAGGIVTINGGTVTANGGPGGAGIGGGAGGNGGTVTINGGTVTATGGEEGAGIGGGEQGAGGIVTINSGTVTANGGTTGAGIGGGIAGEGGTVTINGGTVTATGGDDDGDVGEAIGKSAYGTESGTVNFGEGVNFTINAGADKDNTESKTTAQYSEDHSAAYVSIEEAVKPEIKTVAEVLATVDGGFPISKDTGWVTEQGNKSFIRVVSGEKYICFAKGSKSNAIKVTSKVAKSGENYTCGTGILFTMNNGKLVSITRQEGDDYDGTYIPASDSEQLLKASGAAGGSGDAATEASVPEAAEKAPLTEPFAPAVEPEKFEAEKSEDQLQPAEAVAVEGVEAVE